MQDLAGITWARSGKLSLPLGDFLAHVRRLAALVTAHAKPLSAASEGRIGAKTAKKMLQLVDQLTEIDCQRPPIERSASPAFAREGRALSAEIASAARYVAATNTLVAEQLRRTLSGKKRRSVGAIMFDLEMLADVVRAHPRTVGALLPASTLKDVEVLVRRATEHTAARKGAREQAAIVSRQRTEIIQELQRHSSDVRALAAVLFRRDPELARQFVLPKRRPARRRASEGAVTPSADGTA